MPQIPRKNRELNDAIEVLDEKFMLCRENIQEAWASLAADELHFIDTEIEKCLDARYYLENYHCIKTENGQLKTFYPFWDHQEIVHEAIEEEFAANGYCLIIILKPRQAGISTWISSRMFHRTIFLPQSFTMLVGQNAETAGHIFGMMENAYHLLPWWLRPEYLYKTKGDYMEFQRGDEIKRMTDPGLASAIQVSNAQKMTGVAIGRTLRNFHGCLTKENYVFSADGTMRSIADVSVGEWILTDKQTARITAVSRRNPATIFPGGENGYVITPWCNPAYPIIGTGNHKVLCVKMTSLHVAERRRRKRGERTKKITTAPEMVAFQDLTREHSLAVAVRKIGEGGDVPPAVRTGERKQGGGVQSLWRPPVDRAMIGFAVGLYLAEGTCSARRITLTLDSDEKHLADRFAECVGINGNLVSRPNSRTTQYHFYSASMADWFAKWIGAKDEKRIPPWLWNLGADALSACVEAMILGDGHISKNANVITFTTTRSHLATSIRDAVCSLGHGYGGIHSREAGFHYGRNCQKIYYVRWCNSVNNSLRHTFRWKSSIQSAPKKDSAHWQYSNDKKHVYVNIRSIARKIIDDVYDIEVDTDDHTFLLPGAVTHNSEVSRWPNADIFTADIEPSMNARDEFGIMESTAFGREGLYYEHWRGSVAGDTGWRPVFIPVYRVTKYSLPTPKNFALTPEEITFNARVKREENVEIPDTFWAWRRRRERAAIASTGGPWAHYESYPITPDEAFQSSGICAFDRSSLAFQSMKNARKPQWVGEISLISVDHNHVNTDLIREVAPNEILPKRKGGKSGERLWIWEMPEAGETYYLGADSALGVVDGDYSVAEVFRVGRGADPDEQVAEWWGWINPKHFARMLAALGIWYNGAEISSEYQQAGITTGDTLKDLDYPKLYRPQHKDRVAMTLTNYLHWMTTSKTRDQIIVGMNEALLEKSIILHSEDLIDEMRDFSSLGGRFEGQGNHDDGTVAAMIALYCLRETATHLKTDTNTDRQRQQGDVYIWGVYDQFMRQCGQYNTPAEAERVANGKPGWKIQPILVCNANTIFSPIFSANGAESELHSRHGLHSTEITPDVVYAYKSAMRNFSGAEMGDFGDEW